MAQHIKAPQRKSEDTNGNAVDKRIEAQPCTGEVTR